MQSLLFFIISLNEKECQWVYIIENINKCFLNMIKSNWNKKEGLAILKVVYKRR